MVTYFPILKWKTGEQRALKELHVKCPFIPVIQITDAQEPSDFFSGLHTVYEGPIYFDTVLCGDDDLCILKNYTQFAHDNNIVAWPLVYINDLSAEIDEILAISKRAAISIEIPESFDGPTNKSIIDHVISLHKEFDLFCDSGEVIDRTKANLIYASYKELLNNNAESIKNFKNIVICLTSFPEQLTVESGGVVRYNRFDFKMFMLLYNEFKESFPKLSYSDYGVTKFTDPDLDFRKIKYILPKVKYTTDKEYIVHKGAKNRMQSGFSRSYIDISKEIFHSAYYMGKDFSFGDSNIYEKACSSGAKPGNATNWVSYCANHHLTVVMEQLSTLP